MCVCIFIKKYIYYLCARIAVCASSIKVYLLHEEDSVVCDIFTIDLEYAKYSLVYWNIVYVCVCVCAHLWLVIRTNERTFSNELCEPLGVKNCPWCRCLGNITQCMHYTADIRRDSLSQFGEEMSGKKGSCGARYTSRGVIGVAYTLTRWRVNKVMVRMVWEFCVCFSQICGVSSVLECMCMCVCHCSTDLYLWNVLCVWSYICHNGLRTSNPS